LRAKLQKYFFYKNTFHDNLLFLFILSG
jgi:hypothetical protein